MNTVPSVGTTVRRLEQPNDGLATVAMIEEATIPPYVLLRYEEGGDGWWPIDCIEETTTTEEGQPA